MGECPEKGGRRRMYGREPRRASETMGGPAIQRRDNIA
jgi:hypothetical protein